MNGYYDPEMHGTDNYWKYPLGKGFVYTDSIKLFCEEYKAYWVLDVIGSYIPKFKAYPFLVLTFDVRGSVCDFTAKEDTGLADIVSQHIEYTDLGVSIVLYLDSGVLMFPSDY